MALTNEYRKATSRWQGLIHGSSLWLGSDHVLSVRGMRFSEEYKRFYYREIQALMMREGPRWWCPSWLWFVFALLLVASFFFSVVRRFVFAGACEFSLFTLGCLVLFQSLARGCYCYVVTAVGTTELTGVRTQSAARKTKAALSERIAAVQGTLPEGWQERLTTTNDEPVIQKLRWVSDREFATVVPASGIWAAVAAILCTMIDGVISFGQIRHWPLPEGLGLVNVLLGVAAAVTAVVLLGQRSSFNWLRNAALLCALMMGSVTYLAYIVGNMLTAVPPNARVTLSAVRQGIGVLNVTGDLVMVSVAAALWFRQRIRTAQPVNQPAVSTGEL